MSSFPGPLAPLPRWEAQSHEPWKKTTQDSESALGPRVPSLGGVLTVRSHLWYSSGRGGALSLSPRPPPSN